MVEAGQIEEKHRVKKFSFVRCDITVCFLMEIIQVVCGNVVSGKWGSNQRGMFLSIWEGSNLQMNSLALDRRDNSPIGTTGRARNRGQLHVYMLKWWMWWEKYVEILSSLLLFPQWNSNKDISWGWQMGEIWEVSRMGLWLGSLRLQRLKRKQTFI